MKRALLMSWLIAIQLAAFGCQGFSLKMWDSKPVSDDDEEGPLKTSYIADQVNIAGMHPIMVEGVGLVTRLDGTGEDPAPSLWRTTLLEDMKRRSVEKPEQLLRSPNTALVLIRAAIPPVIKYGERFDVEIVLPPRTEATSLAGGWLLEADLAEKFDPVPGSGRIHSGHILAKCRGPVMLTSGDGSKDSQASLLKRGKVLGGAVYVGGILHEKRKIGLYVRNEFKSQRQTRKISDRIGARFHYHDRGVKKGMANPKTDQHIELTIHPKYKDNYVRYLQVIRRIAMNETPVQQRRRIERLSRDLLDPDKASIAALELEAIGKEGAPVLKEGLKSSNAEVQFYSADALAYLDDSSGVEVLEKMAREEPAFRVYALASLTNLEGVANERLKNLMNDPSAETRYGAFHALRTIDKLDPFLAKEKIGDEFMMYTLRTSGEPLVHLTRHNVSEIALFGSDQRLQPPFSLDAGRHILISGQAGRDVVTVSRFEPGKPDRKEVVSTRLAEVIRAIGKLDGTYPDTVQFLTQAKASACLSARLEYDALPQGGRFYHRPVQVASGGPRSERKQTRIGKLTDTPNLYPTIKDNKPTSASESESPVETLPTNPEASGDDRVASHETEQEAAKPKQENQGFLSRLFPQRTAPGEKPAEPEPESPSPPSERRTTESRPPRTGRDAAAAPASDSRNRTGSARPATTSRPPQEPAIDQVVFEPGSNPPATRPQGGVPTAAPNRSPAPAGETEPFPDTQ